MEQIIGKEKLNPELLKHLQEQRMISFLILSEIHKFVMQIPEKTKEDITKCQAFVENKLGTKYRNSFSESGRTCAIYFSEISLDSFDEDVFTAKMNEMISKLNFLHYSGANVVVGPVSWTKIKNFDINSPEYSDIINE